MNLNDHDLKITSRSVLFRNVHPESVSKLLESCRKQVVARGQTLFIQGDKALDMYVVLDGFVKLTRLTPMGEEIVVAVYSKGQSFAEAAALQAGAYPVTAETVGECILVPISAASIRKALRTDPELALAMLSCTFQHLHELVLEIEHMKALSAVQRLAVFLMTLAPVDVGSCTFALPYDKILIAARLGMKPESLSRALAKLRNIGVTSLGTSIAIAKVEALHEFVDAEKPMRLHDKRA